MKKHYCLVDKAWISYEGECNWCGEKEMKQEPVAWSCWNEDMPCAVILVTKPDMYEWQSIKPLYTAPRELTDDEIITRYREIMSRSSV